MKLLKKIFDADESFDPFFVSSFISQLLTTYLTEFHSSTQNQKKIVKYFNMYPTDPSQSIHNNKLESTIAELMAWQDKSRNFTDSQRHNHPEQGFSIEMHEIKRLDKIFDSLNSRDIKELLHLLDHTNVKVRKLMVLMFQVLLKTKNFKRRMSAKCGLESGPGMVLVNRLKDLAWDPQNEVYLFVLLKQLKSFVEARNLEMQLGKIATKGRAGMLWF
jgi:hypothetical protein